MCKKYPDGKPPIFNALWCSLREFFASVTEAPYSHESAISLDFAGPALRFCAWSATHIADAVMETNKLELIGA